jgi:ubiquitin-protein ligase E3 D
MNEPFREPVYCEQCSTTVGAIDQLANGLRLYKWSLCISTPTSKHHATYPLSHFLTAHLLAHISSQAVNKFILRSSNSDAPVPTASNSTASRPESLSPTASCPASLSPTASSPAILHLWVFAPYLTISLSKSGSETAEPIKASKIFYRPISDQECADMLEKASMSVEEVQLPTEVMTDLVETLWRSTIAIPESARKFREWDVGFLERFVEG